MSLSSTIIYGTADEVARMLLSGADVNAIDEYGYTPLIQAAIMNNFEVARLLITHGADVNRHDLTGGTALHWAAENNNLALCHLLLENKADPNAYNEYGEPILVKPILRRESELRRLFLRYGGNIDFAEDFINAKLLGHRFELVGYVDIVDPVNRFIEIDFEGFFLEFTVGIIKHSLEDYCHNFSAKHLQQYFASIQQVIKVFALTSELMKFEHYRINIEDHQQRIDQLLSEQDLLLIPVSYQGHAIAFIKYGNLLAKVDRSENIAFTDNVVIYKINRPSQMTQALIKQLMFLRNDKQFVDVDIIDLLKLEPVMEFPIGQQITGNCSWANIEACVAVILFMTRLSGSESKQQAERYKNFALSLYQKWREWDKDRALHFAIQSFDSASPARKASKVAILAAVLFQRCSSKIPRDIKRAQKIFPLLRTPGYDYVLNSYIEIYCHQHPGPAGENLMRLLELCDNI